VLRANSRQDCRDGPPAQLTDDIADHKDVQGFLPRCARRLRGYLAYSTDRRSRMTVTFTWPG
jgi:hypothetical protein